MPSGGLGYIRLPVGVGDKGDCCVHGNPRVHAGQGITPRQHGLQALKSEDHQDGYQREEQNAAQIHRPALFSPGIHPGQAVDGPFSFGVFGT